MPYKVPVGTYDRSVGKWRTVMPTEAMAWLSSVTVPWWVAGGWALDLFVGTPTREHEDLDVGVLRCDSMQLLAPSADVSSLWCRPNGAVLWTMEVLLDASDLDYWIFRRNTEIRRPLIEVIRRNSDGVPYLAPEVQLLYKARSMRPKDKADFECVAPRLDCAARTWLRESLLKTYPGHAWTAALDG